MAHRANFYLFKVENINKRTSKQIENGEIGQPNVNMPDANIHTGFENTVQDQNVTWNHGSTYVPNYFTSANGVPIFPQFPPASQSIPIFPQFPPAVNFSSHSNIAMYPGRQNFHQYTPFLGVLEEVERSAKMASKRGV
ncbi:uncharacterized protein LOC123881851 [Trifolium pratense]|uniref:Uncharacterized protein n=2 Tax=Trifolium pratense TaxID=57577 RepID=A0ACB0K9A8_TRIPR|nr:uncharacterized protein LOC123881851 [Trifolium pratense]CAJ2653899.1 unnamed protein product [Trifolium pratense]